MVWMRKCRRKKTKRRHWRKRSKKDEQDTIEHLIIPMSPSHSKSCERNSHLKFSLIQFDRTFNNSDGPFTFKKLRKEFNPKIFLNPV
jgi:hypothetical protein